MHSSSPTHGKSPVVVPELLSSLSVLSPVSDPELPLELSLVSPQSSGFDSPQGL